MEYKIVTGATFPILVNAVNDNLQDGWILVGGPFVAPERIKGALATHDTGDARILYAIGQALSRPCRTITPRRRSMTRNP